MMRESINHSYFFGALSGGFKPPTDQAGKIHTLGMLMNGVLETGAMEDFGSEGQVYSRKPSWSPVIASVAVQGWNIRGLNIMPAPRRVIQPSRSLELVHGFRKAPLGQTSYRTLEVVECGMLIVDEVLGPDATSSHWEIQKEVTDIAQQFFDRLQ